MYQVVKRDGKIASFDISKISTAITKAFEATHMEYNPDIIDLLALRVTADYQDKIHDGKITVEDIQDSVEDILSKAGYADVAKSVIGPKIFGYTEEAETHNIAYDPEGAKAILDAHPGWADEEILFLVPSTPVYSRMGEYFQSNLSEAGFNNVKIETIDWSAWLTESQTDNRFDITLAAWSNVTRDGTELMEPNFHSVSGSRRARLNSEDWALVDGYIDASKTTADTAVRTENLLACNAVLMDEAYVQPIYNSTNLFCYSNDYTNITLDAGGTFYISDFQYASAN